MDIVVDCVAILGFVLSVANWIYTIFSRHRKLDVDPICQWFDSISISEVKVTYCLVLENKSSLNISVTQVFLVDGDKSEPLIFEPAQSKNSSTYQPRLVHLVPYAAMVSYVSAIFPQGEQPNYSIPHTFEVHTTRGTVRKRAKHLVPVRKLYPS